MSHHPCWRQEEQIPSGTPKLVRHPCFWKIPILFHVPGSSDSPSLEQRGVESSLNWCPGGANVFGEAALETGWVTGDCADTAAVWLLGALGSGVGRNPLSLLLFEPLSGILADWSCWGVDSHYSPVFLREQLQNYSLLGFLEGFCLAAGTTLAVPSSGGLWSPGLLLDFEQQTCPAATCQENHLWSHLQTVDDLEVSAVEGWGQAWSGVLLQAGKWDLSRPAEGWFTVRCEASLNSSTLLKCPCCHSRTHCSSNSGLLSFLTPEIFIFWRNIFCLADILKLQNSFRSCRFPNSLEKLSAFPDLLLVSRREKGSVWGWEERGDTSCFFWCLWTLRFLRVFCHGSIQCKGNKLTKAQIP